MMKLKKSRRLFFFVVTLFSVLFTKAYANSSFLNLNPYGGFDIGMQHFGFKSIYGSNLFTKEAPTGNFFVGIKLNDYFGLEAGYESTTAKNKKTSIAAGDYILGNMLDSRDFTNISQNSKVKISGFHLGFTSRYSLAELKNDATLFFVGYVGIKNTRVKAKRDIFKGLPAAGIMEEFHFGVNLNKNNKKSIARVAVGLEYFLYQHLGIKGLIGWENTSKIKPKNYDGGYVSKLKNSYKYSFGIIFK